MWWSILFAMQSGSVNVLSSLQAVDENSSWTKAFNFNLKIKKKKNKFKILHRKSAELSKFCPQNSPVYEGLPSK